MSRERHSISIHFARTLIAAARRNGVDYQKPMRFAGLNERMLENPGLRITPDQLSRLMQEMWRVADDEFMCMGSRPSRHGVFTLMAKQAVRCRNLRAVYHHLGHFYNLVAEALNLELSVTDGEARFALQLADPAKDPDCTLREFLLLLWHRFPSWLIGQRIPLSYVSLDFPEPAHKAEHRLMYPCSARYSQPDCALAFDAAWLDEPVVQTPATLSAYLRRAPLDWFRRQAYYQSYTRRVMDYLERSDVLATTNMDEIAAELNVTSRTLRRKLSDEGTSFQELKDGVRRDAAIHSLSQPSIPISEISRQLGFSEPAAFTRAFKHWTGVPPGIYRRS
ncbi:AraC family transcriptional regulator [Marinobacterium jannaschii]|uniref:AraC family transcriptional regulator n=1 Tax=Marinobacterium jannaschii TaxID=64970 RepID=UPI00047F9CC3|nr:AraC family transcriptional regulator [Marinobacterium jannaschii]